MLYPHYAWSIWEMYPHEKSDTVWVQELDEIRYPSAYDGAWGDPAGTYLGGCPKNG